MSAAVGAAAVGGSSILGPLMLAGGATQILGNFFNNQAIDKQNAANEALWEKQMEYNKPINQMARLKEAGLNPNLVYGGQSVSGNVSTPAPTMQSNRYQFDAQSVLNNYYQIKSLENDLLNSETTRAATNQGVQESIARTNNEILKSAGIQSMNAKTDAEAKSAKVLADYATEVQEMNIETMAKNLKAMDANISATNQNTKESIQRTKGYEPQRREIEQKIGESQERIKNLGTQRKMMGSTMQSQEVHRNYEKNRIINDYWGNVNNSVNTITNTYDKVAGGNSSATKLFKYIK